MDFDFEDFDGETDFNVGLAVVRLLVSHLFSPGRSDFNDKDDFNDQ